MKKVVMMVAASILLAFMIGCSTTAPNYVNSAPLSEVDFSKHMEKGTSCETIFLIFGPFGKSSVVDAAKNAEISKVELVEYEQKNMLLIRQNCITAYGR